MGGYNELGPYRVLFQYLELFQNRPCEGLFKADAIPRREILGTR